MNYRFLLSIIFILIFYKSDAQDLLIRKYEKPDTIYVRIIEITNFQIRYYLWPVDTNLPVFVSNRSNLKKFEFENSERIKRFIGNKSGIRDTLYLKPYAEHKPIDYKESTIIKVAPTVLFFGYTALSFEKSVKPNRSIETTIGLIGLGFNRELFDQTGLFFKIGYKLYKSPGTNDPPHKNTRNLNGLYFQPEFNSLFHIDNSKSSVDRTIGFSIMGNVGHQVVLENRFCLDYYFGLGIGAKATNNSISYGYSLRKDNNFLPYGFFATSAINQMSFLCISAGMKFGYKMQK